ncbi:MAG TPA: GNAT family N-acetyltransferase [Actinomycetota bacterium]|nr:GNAT family N-acetyltransferase [Actinomycetota bacterium]
MVEIRGAGADEWSTIRKVRLAALTDTPDAFWATHVEEIDKPEAWWRHFINAGAWFLAWDGDRAVGIVAVLRDPELGEATRRLISMWVHPEARGAGIGVELVDAAVAWARVDGAREVQLEVTAGNDAAARLYERCGFSPTGVTTPLPRDPALIESEYLLVL